MPAPVASGWSESPGGACTHWKAPPCHGAHPDQTLAQVLTDGSGDMVTVEGQSRHVIGYMKDFLYRPEQARTPVGALSGGKRARLDIG
jgi:ATPase subunit of ABC transporter with duplicated ATPase domains